MTYYRSWCVFTIVICLPLVFGTGAVAASMLDIGTVRLGETKVLSFYLPNATIGNVNTTSPALQIFDADCETELTSIEGTLVEEDEEEEEEEEYEYNVCVIAQSSDAGRYGVYENITMDEAALFTTLRVLVTQPLAYVGPTIGRILQGGEALTIEGNISDTYDVREYGVQLVAPPAHGTLKRGEEVITMDDDNTLAFPLSYSVSTSTNATTDSFTFFVYPLSNKTLRSDNVTFEIDIDVIPRVTASAFVTGILRKLVHSLNVKIAHVQSDQRMRFSAAQEEGESIGFLFVPRWKYTDFTNRAGFEMIECSSHPEFPVCNELVVEGFASDVNEFAGNISFIAAMAGTVNLTYTITNLNSTNTTVSFSSTSTVVQISEESPEGNLLDTVLGTTSVILGSIAVFGAICLVFFMSYHNFIRRKVANKLT